MGIQNIKGFLQGKYFKKNRRPEMITDLNYTHRSSSDSTMLLHTPASIRTRQNISLSLLYPVFTVSLDDAVRLNSNYTQPLFDTGLCLPELQPHVPIIVLKLVEYITNYGLSEEGIYRVSGSTASIKKLKQRIVDEGPTFDLSPEEFDIHTITSVLKLYLRELPIDIFKVCADNEELRYVPEGYDYASTSLKLRKGRDSVNVSRNASTSTISAIGNITPIASITPTGDNPVTSVSITPVRRPPTTSITGDIPITSVSITPIRRPPTPSDLISRPNTPSTPTPGLSEVPELCPSSPDSQREPESPMSPSLPRFESSYMLVAKPKETPLTPSGYISDTVKNELMQLRVSHFALLHVITRHLANVAANCDKNRMSIPNLVVIFSATLRMHKMVLSELITKGDLSFEDIPLNEKEKVETRVEELEEGANDSTKEMACRQMLFPLLNEKINDDFNRRRKNRRSAIRARATSFDFFDPGFFRSRPQTAS